MWGWEKWQEVQGPRQDGHLWVSKNPQLTDGAQARRTPRPQRVEGTRWETQLRTAEAEVPLFPLWSLTKPLPLSRLLPADSSRSTHRPRLRGLWGSQSRVAKPTQGPGAPARQAPSCSPPCFPQPRSSRGSQAGCHSTHLCLPLCKMGRKFSPGEAVSRLSQTLSKLML